MTKTNIVLIILLFIYCGNDNSTSTLTELIWVYYNSTNSGLVNDTISVIIEDYSGSMWIGTRSKGISKYDGSNWTTYDTLNGLNDQRINAIAIDKNNNTWVGTDGGLSKFDGIMWTNYDTSSGLARPKVQSVAVDSNGNIWFVCHGYMNTNIFTVITKMEGDSWTNYELKNDYVVCPIAIDTSGNVWFASYGGGIFQYNWKEFHIYTKKAGLPTDFFFSINVDKYNYVWAGSNGKGVIGFNGHAWKINYTSKNTSGGLISDFVNAITTDIDGNLLFGTPNGVSIYNISRKKWSSYSVENGLMQHGVICIFTDSNGNIWFGSIGMGISVLLTNNSLTVRK